MAGAEKIKEKIMEDARQVAEANMSNARAEAARIMREANQDVKIKTEQILTKADEEASDTIKKMIAVAQLEARKKKLAVKQKMVEKAFNGVIEKMATLPATEYQKLLENMIIDGSKDGSEEILVSLADKQRLNGQFIVNINTGLAKRGLKGQMKLSEQPADIQGGFVLRQGNVEMNNSFETILKMMRDTLETDVVRILFE